MCESLERWSFEAESKTVSRGWQIQDLLKWLCSSLIVWPISLSLHFWFSSISCPFKLGSNSSVGKVGHCCEGRRAVADPGFAETLQHQQLDQYSLLSGTTHHPPLVAPPQPTGTHRKSKLFRNPLLTNTPFSWEAQHDPTVPVASHRVSSQESKLSHESRKGLCDFVKSTLNRK